jgi:hypothetical protein
LNRWMLGKLTRDAQQDAVIIRQAKPGGGMRAFPRMQVLRELWLKRVNDALGEPTSGEVLDALENATPESRRAVEEMTRPEPGEFLFGAEPLYPDEEVGDLSE